MASEPVAYSIGNENNPADPFGRVALRISAAGAAQLEHVSRAERRTWTAIVRPEALHQLRAALAASGFPTVPPGLPVPDSAVRTLTVGSTTALVEPKVAGLAFYADAFALLDAIADEISGGTIRPRPPTGQPLVTSIARV